MYAVNILSVVPWYSQTTTIEVVFSCPTYKVVEQYGNLCNRLFLKSKYYDLNKRILIIQRCGVLKLTLFRYF